VFLVCEPVKVNKIWKKGPITHLWIVDHTSGESNSRFQFLVCELNSRFQCYYLFVCIYSSV